MSVPLQFRCISTQQARSAGVIWASGNVHAMAGTSDQTSSNTTAPSWRERFTTMLGYSNEAAGFTSKRLPSLYDKDWFHGRSRNRIGPEGCIRDLVMECDKLHERRPVCPSNSLVVYRGNCGRKALKIQNEQKVIAQTKRKASKGS
jgi:hypothetical protein